jgi:hypothetical protein
MPQPEEQTEDEAAPPSAELLSAATELLSNVTLVDVRPCAISATLEEGVSPGAHIASVEIELASSFAVDMGVYGNRFDYRFQLNGAEQGQTLGSIEFSILLDYDVVENFEPDRDAADFITRTTGFFAAYPYARELFQSLADRLQFDPVILGLIKRGSMRPGSVTVVPHEAVEL